MNTVMASPMHRARVLRALGLVAWQRRATSQNAQAVAIAQPLSIRQTAVSVGIVVVFPPGCTVRELDLLGRALTTCGASFARAPRIEAGDGEIMQVPHAPLYLVFGQAQAHALGRALPVEVMRDAHIALADTPSELLTQASAKRRLWQILRRLRRALVAGSG